jgi:aspartate aminotransferase-like enzyme
MQHLKLMIPGPIEVEDEVLEQMGAPVQAHYGDAWVAIHNETIGLLQQVIGTTGKVFMLPGSGSLAGDAIIHTLFAPGERVAVGINGHFGHRWEEIMQSNGVDAVVLEFPPDQPLDPAAFDRLLAEDKAISGVVAVHLETSSAVLNPIREIAAVCRKHNRLLCWRPAHRRDWAAWRDSALSPSMTAPGMRSQASQSARIAGISTCAAGSGMPRTGATGIRSRSRCPVR